MTDDVTLTEHEQKALLADARRHRTTGTGCPSCIAGIERLAAHIEAAEAQEAGLRDEVDRLERWKAEALAVMDGLQQLGRALGLRLGEQTTGPRAVEAAEALVAERDRLSERVKSVRALADSEVARLSAATSADPWQEPMLSNYLGGIKATIAALDQDGGE